TSGQNDTLNNFAFCPMPNVKELEINNFVWGMPPRPGFTYGIRLDYKNNGTIPMNGTISFKHDPLCSFVSSNPANDGISGDTIIWNFTNLLVGETRNIFVTQYVPVGTPLSTPISMYSQIMPVIGDTFPANNYDSLHPLVVGSYDPNDKAVNPDRPLLMSEITYPVPLTYLIRFQNTGTFYAEKVFVRDTLSSNLDFSSFEMIAASHKYSLNYIDPGILEWTFDSIMLPDSTTDEANSHGFISYRIKPLTSLSETDTIYNMAYIYFDFNEPVLTNTTESYLEATVVSIPEITNSGNLKIFPNPTHDEFTVEVIEKVIYPCKVKIYNSLANIVMTKEITQPIATINCQGLKSGFYFIIVEDKYGSIAGKGKMIKQ
ncbi:MAG: T9SS type A sorting domain-containing protein, partial [Bacteroidota bacterium]